MKIAVVGVGYVGLVSAACFADLGAEVYCVDVDKERIDRLKEGIMPIYEPALDQLVLRGIKAKRLHFSTSIADILDDIEIVFIAVGTPPKEDGSADLKHVLSVAHEIGCNLRDYCLVVTKSTVPVGSSEKVRAAIQEELDRRGKRISFDMASNPEFLKEGNAIEDFMKPDRVVVGVDSKRAEDLMTRLYKPMLLNKFRVIFMDIASAEMTKYAANAMLATRISFMNEVALLCEKVGADINMVRQGIGSDKRIGDKFLYAGCGYGGSCFPKDVNALIHTGLEAGEDMQILQAVERVNERQKSVLFEKFKDYYHGNIAGKKVAIWGLAFKPETDDIRQATSLRLIDQLLAANCIVSVYDPIAMEGIRELYGKRLRYALDVYDCSLEAEAIFHVTEWKEFRMPSWSVLRKSVKKPLLIDGRNVFDRTLQEYGFDYLCIGKG